MPSLLDRIETVGNRLPDPATVFVIALGVVMIGSAVVAELGVAVQRGDTIVSAQSLLASDGIWWLIRHSVENFVNFPPLGVVLVGMLGIGLAEKSGLIDCAMRGFVARVPAQLITPTIVGLGVISSLGLDAGYVVLPPLAAIVYQRLGRSPIAGVAAAFAGVSAGFSANLIPTAIDPLLTGFTVSGARLLEPSYDLAITANWYFMAASAVVLTTVGWWVSVQIVEPRCAGITLTDNANEFSNDDVSRTNNERGLHAAAISLAIIAVGIALAVMIEGAPLNGQGLRFARWVEGMVPVLALVFFIPGMVFGLRSGRFRSDRDVAKALGEVMSELGPYIVLAFFAAQFIAAFNHSNLGEMIAFAGGKTLASWALPTPFLLLCFTVLVMFANLLIGSASAKYAFIAPIFVPLFMQAGIPPEATQAAYRVGDSVTNVITPLNPYMVIIVAHFMRFAPGCRLGTVIATMMPYSIAYALVWLPMLALWIGLGVSLGPNS